MDINRRSIITIFITPPSPFIVNVFPDPVWPYVNIDPLYPCRQELIIGLATASNTSVC